ncbi:MAG: hypothetical protein OEW21_02880 [Betaproteobacteria bacterium]|nr:hypothetical protein [Betaproteobacteria bacterium]
MSSRMRLRSFALLAALVFAAAAIAENLPSRSSSASGVTLSVTPRSLAGPVWEFDVTLNTHSQDLTDDLLKTAVLAADGGAASAPVGWEGDAAGGHHRKGVLRFAALASSSAAIELRIQRPGEPAPRVFRWALR